MGMIRCILVELNAGLISNALVGCPHRKIQTYNNQTAAQGNWSINCALAHAHLALCCQRMGESDERPTYTSRDPITADGFTILRGSTWLTGQSRGVDAEGFCHDRLKVLQFPHLLETDFVSRLECSSNLFGESCQGVAILQQVPGCTNQRSSRCLATGADEGGTVYVDFFSCHATFILIVSQDVGKKVRPCSIGFDPLLRLLCGQSSMISQGLQCLFRNEKTKQSLQWRKA